jgi:hypothetical protein
LFLSLIVFFFFTFNTRKRVLEQKNETDHNNFSFEHTILQQAKLFFFSNNFLDRFHEGAGVELRRQQVCAVSSLLFDNALDRL